MVENRKMSKKLIKTPAKGFQKLYALQPKGLIDLSVSENPLGCSPLVMRVFKRLRPNFNDYPDPRATELVQALADFFVCQPDQILIGNGSESFILEICRLLVKSDEEISAPKLTFPMFALSGELIGARIRLVPMDTKLGINLDQVSKLINSNTKLIFLCNPNNPTGSVLAKAKLLKFLKNLPTRVVCVVDEANIEFGGESVLPEVLKLKNILVLRTFSKAFGLAALRVGCVVGDSRLINRLREQMPIFPVSSISQQLVAVALKDKQFLIKTKKFIEKEREFLTKELKRLGFTVFPSQANNLFVKLPNNVKTTEFWNFLDEASVSLVKGESFHGLTNLFFRVSPRLRKTNRQFISVLEQFFKFSSGSK